MLADLVRSLTLGSLPFAARAVQIGVPSISDAAIIVGLFIAITGALTALVTAINTYRGSKTITDQFASFREEIEKLKQDLKATREELEFEKRKRELNESALSYLASTFIAQHPAEVNYALAISRGEEDAPNPDNTPHPHTLGRDSDPKLRAARKNK